MANKKNKVKFGLQNVYWAKINEWGEDPDGNKTVPAYGPSKHLPGAVSLSIFLRTTVYITSSTTTPATQATLKSPLSQPNLRLKSLVKFSITMVFLWKEMIQNLHSLH